MSEYITNAEFKKQKSALTRAINSGDPVKVLEAVEKTLDEWIGKCWPDDWSRWARALDDAFWAFTRKWESAYETEDRFRDCMSRFA